MKQSTTPDPADPLSDLLPEARNFSLVLGGPLYQLFRKAHLDDDVTSHLKRRIFVICCILWLPLGMRRWATMAYRSLFPASGFHG